MDGQSIRNLADIIIMIGAIIGAITAIYHFLKKPSKLMKDRAKILEEKDRKMIKEELNNQSKNITENTLKQLNPILIEIREMNLNQTRAISLLNQSVRDLLRQRILDIYHIYKENKILPAYIKENLKELYSDYKGQGGNSYIDRIYARMLEWDTEEDLEELEEKS